MSSGPICSSFFHPGTLLQVHDHIVLEHVRYIDNGWMSYDQCALRIVNKNDLLLVTDEVGFDELELDNCVIVFFSHNAFRASVKDLSTHVRIISNI